jgi:hypothetical protein
MKAGGAHGCGPFFATIFKAMLKFKRAAATYGKTVNRTEQPVVLSASRLASCTVQGRQGISNAAKREPWCGGTAASAAGLLAGAD